MQESISSAGIGGVLRDDTGHLIMAFSVPTQSKSNNQAEAMGALHAIEWCNRIGYDKYDLQLDSMVITNMLEEKDTNNVKLKSIIKRTVNAMEGAEVSISHCYREANQVADFLPKLASSSGNGPKTVARALQQRFYNRLIYSCYYSSIVTVNVTVLESVAIGTSIATVFCPSIGTIILQQL
ncbi:hypothetical protein MTR67_049503 [Solanum verrucosum]|uniref:RNase H type-1 domain-containing protein n=1 Tax=Solanum verrucosum TaxID=315347 RepID=A0AAF1A0B4_SOLVR|nr:hypothetical protein MTR67_049503 [Solanum verrucosum]